jgi:hypothetical protein
VIILVPNVLGPRTIATQPQYTIDSAQVEALRNVVVFADMAGSNRQGTWWRLMLRAWMPDVTFRLITILKSEVRAKLKRTKSHAKLNCAFIDSVDRGPLREAEVGNCDLYGLKGRPALRSGEAFIGKQFQAGLVELNLIPPKLF